MIGSITQGTTSAMSLIHVKIWMLVLIVCIMSSCYAVPLSRESPPANSHECASTYHGQCIDTYKYQCMGIAVPGICGGLSGPFGELTGMQCCSGVSYEIGRR